MPQRDPEAYREYMRKYMLDRYTKRRAEAIETLGGKCKICESTVDLQFDHVDPSGKAFTIAKFSSASERKFREEIVKCQLLCRPCHVKKTMQDNGQQDARETHGTLSSYRYCKCDLCREAKAAWYREYAKTHVRKRDR